MLVNLLICCCLLFVVFWLFGLCLLFSCLVVSGFEWFT